MNNLLGAAAWLVLLAALAAVTLTWLVAEAVAPRRCGCGGRLDELFVWRRTARRRGPHYRCRSCGRRFHTTPSGLVEDPADHQ